MKRLLIAIAALIYFPFIASADDRTEATIGAWDIVSFRNDNTGNFSHCVAMAYYKSGINIVMSIDSSFRWRMGFYNIRWDLAEGSSHPIMFWIDNGRSIPAQAKVAGRHMVVVDLSDSPKLFEAFRRGRLLTVQTESDRFFFDLTDSSRSLQAALQCTVRYASSMTVSSRNPFSSAPRVNAEVSDSTLRSEASMFTANLLSTAGVSGFQMVDAAAKEFAPFHAVFVAPGLVGGTVVGPSTDVETATRELLNSAAGNCAGRFASTKIPQAGGGYHIQTICETQNKGSEEASYFAIPRAKGGVYGFVLMKMEQGSTESVDALPPPAQASPRAISEKLLDASVNNN